MPRLVTLLPMACDGVGPSFTCTRLLLGMAQEGLAGPFMVHRLRVRTKVLDVRPAVPRPLSALPYKLYKTAATQRSIHRLLDELRPDDVAYLWPLVPLDVYEAVHARNIPIVSEGINTRLAWCKAPLDAAYAAEGLAPNHGITDALITEEDAKLALTTAFFAPSPAVELALDGSPLDPSAIIPASYGTDLAAAGARPSQPASDRLRVLFVGYGCIRKGLHHLLRAWARADIAGHLTIAGALEPALRTLCKAELARPDVSALGFVRNVSALYDQADVFILPSIEEGDPLVIYEAAAHGLAIVATAIGGGRLADRSGAILTVPPAAPDAIGAVLSDLAADRDRVRYLGTRCRAAAQSYDWTTVGRSRAVELRHRLGVASASTPA